MSFVYHLMVLVILCQNKRYNAFLLDNIATDDKIIIQQILAFDPVLRALSTHIAAVFAFGDDSLKTPLLCQLKQRNTVGFDIAGD